MGLQFPRHVEQGVGREARHVVERDRVVEQEVHRQSDGKRRRLGRFGELLLEVGDLPLKLRPLLSARDRDARHLKLGRLRLSVSPLRLGQDFCGRTSQGAIRERLDLGCSRRGCRH